VDGAFGALAVLSPELAVKLRGIELADSIAFDFHKWTQVPYDAGFILVRDRAKHIASFENPADYLSRDPRAMSAASPWPCDLGPDLSRGFRALKTWMTFKVYGTRQIGRVMTENCRLASYLAERIQRHDELELLAPVPLNIVCFRYRSDDSDRVNQDIVAAVQRAGLVAPSSTRVAGVFAIRAAIFNHRTTVHDIDQLLEEVLRHARQLTSGSHTTHATER
jgi:glutamate/tyrosine decarboxylase-like PLP-dependent enzyme